MTFKDQSDINSVYPQLTILYDEIYKEFQLLEKFAFKKHKNEIKKFKRRLITTIFVLFLFALGINYLLLSLVNFKNNNGLPVKNKQQQEMKTEGPTENFDSTKLLILGDSLYSPVDISSDTISAKQTRKFPENFEGFILNIFLLIFFLPFIGAVLRPFFPYKVFLNEQRNIYIAVKNGSDLIKKYANFYYIYCFARQLDHYVKTNKSIKIRELVSNLLIYNNLVPFPIYYVDSGAIRFEPRGFSHSEFIKKFSENFSWFKVPEISINALQSYENLSAILKLLIQAPQKKEIGELLISQLQNLSRNLAVYEALKLNDKKFESQLILNEEKEVLQELARENFASSFLSIKSPVFQKYSFYSKTYKFFEKIYKSQFGKLLFSPSPLIRITVMYFVALVFNTFLALLFCTIFGVAFEGNVIAGILGASAALGIYLTKDVFLD